MERHGRAFTVTWAGRPAFQNPPLQIWLMARSFALFGENDFAARLPSILMALGILGGVYRIGRLTVGPAAGHGGRGLAPDLADVRQPRAAQHARPAADVLGGRCPSSSSSRGCGGRASHALFAVPLGAAILTKSVLGLLPLGLLFAGALACAPLRASLRRGWIWLGVLGGLALGASWTIQQLVVFGPDAVRAHYLGEIVVAVHAAAGLRGSSSLDYPAALLGAYQPVILPGLVGAVLLWRRHRHDPESAVAPAAGLGGPAHRRSTACPARAPPAISFRSSRRWRCARATGSRRRSRASRPRSGDGSRRRWRWRRPPSSGSAPRSWRRAGPTSSRPTAVIRGRVPEGEPLTYLGTWADYWGLANPILYYTDRRLEAPSEAAADALRAAGSRRSGLILVQRSRLDEIQGPGYDVVLERPDWVLLQPRFDPGRSSD